jgi:hypothetical protein
VKVSCRFYTVYEWDLLPRVTLGNEPSWGSHGPIAWAWIGWLKWGVCLHLDL